MPSADGEERRRAPDGVSYTRAEFAQFYGGLNEWNAANMPDVDPSIVATFNYFDANGSGFLDYRELRNALHHYGIDVDAKQAAEMVMRYDDQPDGKMELGEFAELVRDVEQGVLRAARAAPQREVPAARNEPKGPPRFAEIPAFGSRSQPEITDIRVCGGRSPAGAAS